MDLPKAARTTWLTILILSLFGVARSEEATWPRFRGPDGLGIAPDERSYPVQLDPSANCFWKIELPEGHSSPCIWGNRIFLTASSGKVLETICIDRTDGRILWRRSIEPETMQKITNMNSHASATPACDGQRVYVHFGSFGLLAYDLDGKELWTKPLPIPVSQHGSGASPILADRLVIMNCDQNTDAYLLGVNCESGETVWRHDNAQKRNPGYSTPVLWKHGQEQELIVLSSKRITSYDPADGQQRWQLRSLETWTTPSPTYAGETLFAMGTATTTGDPVNPVELPDYKELLDSYDLDHDQRVTQAEIPDDFALIYRMGPMYTSLKDRFSGVDTDHDGAISEAEWTPVVTSMANMKPKQLDTFVAVRSGAQGDANESYIKWSTNEGVGQVPTPLVYRQRVYLVKEGGVLTCFQSETGQRLYSAKLGTRTHFLASPVAADGKVYICSQPGTVIVVKAADEFEVLSRTKFAERIRATPALLDGKIYLRTEKHLFAFGNK